MASEWTHVEGGSVDCVFDNAIVDVVEGGFVVELELIMTGKVELATMIVFVWDTVLLGTLLDSD